MINRELNYGRHLIKNFGAKALNQVIIPQVLDVGAGSGSDLQIIKNVAPNSILHAIECYPPNVENLQIQNIKTKSIDIENDPFPFPDEHFDLILSNQVLEHTKEVFWILHEMSRTLKVNGHLIIGLPNLASLHNRILLLLGKQPTSIKTASAHVRGFTKQDFLNFLESCFPGGFELSEFGGSNFYPFPPFIARPLAQIWPQAAWGIFFLIKKTKPYDNKSFLDFPIKEKLETNFYLGN